MKRLLWGLALIGVLAGQHAAAQDRMTLPRAGLEVVYDYGINTPTLRISKVLRVEGDRHLIGSKNVKRNPDIVTPRYDDSTGYEYQYWVSDEFRVESVKDPAIDSGKTKSATCRRSLPASQMRDLRPQSVIQFTNTCDTVMSDGTQNTTSVEYRRIVIRKEKLTVGSGSFDTIVYRRERLDSGGAVSETNTLWFAPALGMVLREESEGVIRGQAVKLITWAVAVSP